MGQKEYCNLGGDSIKRPIVVIAIGYCIGIIWGLYFRFSIVLLYILIAFLYGVKKLLFMSTKDNNYYLKLLFCSNFGTHFFPHKRVKMKSVNENKKFQLFSIKRYIRYIKLFLTKSVISVIIVSSIISNIIFIFQESRYNHLYEEKTIKVEGIIISNKQEREYKNRYKVKVLTVDNSTKYHSTQIYIDVKKEVEFQYGDKVILQGEFQKGSKARNTGGFDYQLYLKSISIYGTLNVNKYEIVSSNNVTVLEKGINDVKLAINQKIEGTLEEEEQQIVKGLLLGDTTVLEEDLQEQFQIANISHVLAVSGMHVVYIIMGIEIFFKKWLGKRKVKYIMILAVIFYVSITGATSSIVRAGIMEILSILSFLVYRKKDIWTSIAFSLLCILIQNPYAIKRCGITIILFRNNRYYLIS